MGKSNKKKQVEQVYLEDYIGSWSQAFLTVRSVVWSMVEDVACQSDDDHFNVSNNDSSSLNDLGLPLSFGSSKSQKKRKQQQQDHETPGKRLRTHGKSKKKIALPILEDNGDKLIEHNIGFVYDECGNQKWFRVLGMSPDGSNSSMQEKASNQSQFMMTVRYLHTRDQHVLNRMDNRVHFAYHTSHETLAYQQAESDLWHSFNWDKPIDVHEKYWDQRYRIFRKFDEHVQLDGESWYSITYEQLAGYVVEKCQDLFESCAQRSSNGSSVGSSSRLNLVLDCFSGCGGCTIPFAQLPDCHVLAVDMDEKKLKYLE
jgi:hypothetical protein